MFWPPSLNDRREVEERGGVGGERQRWRRGVEVEVEKREAEVEVEEIG